MSTIRRKSKRGCSNCARLSEPKASSMGYIEVCTSKRLCRKLSQWRKRKDKRSPCYLCERAVFTFNFEGAVPGHYQRCDTCLRNPDHELPTDNYVLTAAYIPGATATSGVTK